MSLLHLEQATPADDVAETLRDEILSGYFPPGSGVSDAEVMSRLGVSRDHAKAALGRRERGGLLSLPRPRGLGVGRTSVDAARALSAPRRTREPAGRAARARRRPADDVWLQAAVTSMTEAAK